MVFNRVVIWVDHEEAHLIHFNLDTSEKELKTILLTQPQAHIKLGVIGAGPGNDHVRFFKDILHAILAASEILLVGANEEKHDLMSYIIRHHRAIAEKVVGVVTADHPSDDQLLRFGFRYFAKIDQMRVDPIASLRDKVRCFN